MHDMEVPFYPRQRVSKISMEGIGWLDCHGHLKTRANNRHRAYPGKARITISSANGES